MVGEDNACLEDLDGLLGGHRGAAQRWRMMSRQVPRHILWRVTFKSDREESRISPFQKEMKKCFPNLFQLLIFAAICFDWCCFFQPAFIKSFTPSFKTATSLSPPACKFVQKSANYDCGDKNVKLYINWCIIFGVDLCLIHFQNMKYTYNHCYKM